jgi:ketosteroid isomerase-like protein
VGVEAVSQYMSRFLQFWKHFTLESEKLRWAGDTVLVDAILRGEGTKSGVDVEGTFFIRVTFRGRKIIRIESMLDEDEALEAAGLRE